MAAKKKDSASIDTKSEEKHSLETIIVCDHQVDIAKAGALRDVLLAALIDKKPVVLDAGDVERVDTAALQVLTAFFVDANAQNLKARWQNPSSAIINAASLLGLTDSLGLARNEV